MKKNFIILSILVGTLFANSGQEIYDSKCVACHQMKGMMDMSKMKEMKAKMQTASAQEKAQMKAKMKEKMAKSGMRAPPMNMVSLMIKKTYASKEEFTAFVKDYIVNPSKDKGVCMPMAYKRFGTMPPIGKGMSEEERTLVAEWMFDTFKGKWADSKDGKTCDSNNAGAKKSSNKVFSTRDAESKSTVK